MHYCIVVNIEALEIELGLDQGLGFPVSRVQAQAFLTFLGWVFLGLRPRIRLGLINQTPESRIRSRLFKNLDL